MRRPCGWMSVVMAIAVSIVLSGCGRGAPDRASGETVALEQVPAPVRTTIERQRQGGHVETIQRRAKNGRSLYVVTIAQGDQEQRLILADDGKLVSSRPAGDDEEDDD